MTAMKKITTLVITIALLLASFNTGNAKEALKGRAQAISGDYSIEKALAVSPKKLPKLNKYDYSTEYFKLRVFSPSAGYRYAIKNKDKTVYHKHKRKKNDGYSLEEDDLSEIDFWDYNKDLVTVFILPQPQTKNVVKLGRLLGYTTAAAFTVITFGIGMATLGLPGKISGYKVSKDFYDMNVVNSDKEVICSTVDKDISVMTKVAQQYFFPDDHFEDFVNKLFLGVYQFDPKCFMNEGKTKLVIKDKKGKRVLNFKIPNKLKDSIWTDFAIGSDYKVEDL